MRLSIKTSDTIVVFLFLQDANKVTIMQLINICFKAKSLEYIRLKTLNRFLIASGSQYIGNMHGFKRQFFVLDVPIQLHQAA